METVGCFVATNLATELIEEQIVELVGRDWSKTQFKVLEHINKLFPID